MLAVVFWPHLWRQQNSQLVAQSQFPTNILGFLPCNGHKMFHAVVGSKKVFGVKKRTVFKENHVNSKRNVLYIIQKLFPLIPKIKL